jgi:hypothetical protein
MVRLHGEDVTRSQKFSKQRKNSNFLTLANKICFTFDRLCAVAIAVLPTSGMCVLPDQLKKSAAGEKIRPHTLEAVFVDVYKDS